MARLRAADRLLAPLVRAAVADLTDLTEADRAAARLAEMYAESIDAADDAAEIIGDLGPKLLACLNALGATPQARASRKAGAPARPSAGGALGAIRGSRAG